MYDVFFAPVVLKTLLSIAACYQASFMVRFNATESVLETHR